MTIDLPTGGGLLTTASTNILAQIMGDSHLSKSLDMIYGRGVLIGPNQREQSMDENFRKSQEHRRSFAPKNEFRQRYALCPEPLAVSVNGVVVTCKKEDVTYEAFFLVRMEFEFYPGLYTPNRKRLVNIRKYKESEIGAAGDPGEFPTPVGSRYQGRRQRYPRMTVSMPFLGDTVKANNAGRVCQRLVEGAVYFTDNLEVLYPFKVNYSVGTSQNPRIFKDASDPKIWPELGAAAKALGVPDLERQPFVFVSLSLVKLEQLFETRDGKCVQISIDNHDELLRSVFNCGLMENFMIRDTGRMNDIITVICEQVSQKCPKEQLTELRNIFARVFPIEESKELDLETPGKKRSGSRSRRLEFRGHKAGAKANDELIKSTPGNVVYDGIFTEEDGTSVRVSESISDGWTIGDIK